MNMGSLKVGETILPITSMTFRAGMLYVTGMLPGPVAADSGNCHLFDSDGNWIISNRGISSFPDTDLGGCVIVELPIRIYPDDPNPLPKKWKIGHL